MEYESQGYSCINLKTRTEGEKSSLLRQPIPRTNMCMQHYPSFNSILDSSREVYKLNDIQVYPMVDDQLSDVCCCRDIDKNEHYNGFCKMEEKFYSVNFLSLKAKEECINYNNFSRHLYNIINIA